MRTTPDNITALAPHEVFVFGSNLAGRHGAGAAKRAMQWGAKYGRGWGLFGQTYALPTLDEHLDKLPLLRIEEGVIALKICAEIRPGTTFLVTEVGCGLAGFTVEEIAPLFARCKDVENIHLPARFWEVLNRDELEPVGGLTHDPRNS